MSFGGNKSKQSSSGTQNQTQTNYLGQAGIDAINAGMNRIGGYQYQGVTPEMIQGFESPYQQSVIDSTLADINRQQQMSLQQGGDAAQAAGAFGGSRHGVSDALTRSEYDRNATGAVANLRNQGYQTALAAALAEAQGRNQFQMGQEGLYGNYAQLLAQHGSRSDLSGSQTGQTTGKSSNFGFSWAPKIPGMG